MGLLGILFGSSGRRKSKREAYFAITTAADALSGRAGLRVKDRAGLVYNPVESKFFDNLDSEVRELLKVSGRATGTRHQLHADSFGTHWVVLDDRDFEDLVATIHSVGETITEHGFDERLLAAVFSFDYEGKDAYWIYNIKRGNFYPLVLSGEKQRDNAAEMRLGALMEEEKVPVERSLERWYSLWGIPF